MNWPKNEYELTEMRTNWLKCELTWERIELRTITGDITWEQSGTYYVDTPANKQRRLDVVVQPSNNAIWTSPRRHTHIVVTSLGRRHMWNDDFMQLYIWRRGDVQSLIALFVLFGLYVAFSNISVISRLDVAGSSMLTFRVLPHWNITPQALGMIFLPVTLYWH